MKNGTAISGKLSIPENRPDRRQFHAVIVHSPRPVGTECVERFRRDTGHLKGVTHGQGQAPAVPGRARDVIRIIRDSPSIDSGASLQPVRFGRSPIGQQDRHSPVAETQSVSSPIKGPANTRRQCFQG